MKHVRNLGAISSAVALAALHFPAPRSFGRLRTVDMMTYDGAMRTMDGHGNMLGKPLGGAFRTHDGRTVDSTGAFLNGELERLDLTLHEPLVSISYLRDIRLREDVTLADEVSSFTVSTYAASGGLGTGQTIGGGKSWIAKNSTQIGRQSVDIAKITQPLIPWGEEVAYTVLELESAAKVGRPVDEQKYLAMKMKHQMDIDAQVYIGDVPSLVYGLINSNNRSGADAVLNVANVANGAQGSPLWTMKTPDEILQDFNEILTSAWAAAAWAVMPDSVLLPPEAYGYIATQKVSAAGNMSILTYVLENNITAKQGGAELSIKPLKWAKGAGVGGTLGISNGHDRMTAYTNEKDRVRYPMTMLSKTALQYNGIWQAATYYGRLGQLEIVYPETIAYRDGLS